MVIDSCKAYSNVQSIFSSSIHIEKWYCSSSKAYSNVQSIFSSSIQITRDIVLPRPIPICNPFSHLEFTLKGTLFFQSLFQFVIDFLTINSHWKEHCFSKAYSNVKSVFSLSIHIKKDLARNPKPKRATNKPHLLVWSALHRLLPFFVLWNSEEIQRERERSNGEQHLQRCLLANLCADQVPM